MAAIVNARDLRLQATNPRIEIVTLEPNVIVPPAQVDGLPDVIVGTKVVYLRATSEVFQIAKTGIITPAVITLSASLRNMVAPAAWSIIDGNATLGVLGDGSRTLAYADMATDSVTIRVTGIENNVTYDDKITIVKLREGTDTVNMILSNEAHAIPADPLGRAQSYTGAGTNVTIYVGATDTTSKWTITRVDSSGVTSTIANNQVSVTSMADSATSGYIDITAARAGFTSITKRMSLTKTNSGQSGSNGSNGQRGTVNVAVSGYASWSDSAANAALVSMGYGSPQNRDIVTLYDSSHSVTKFYNNGSWLQLDAYINGNMLVSGTLSASQITTGYMVADRISGGTLRLANGNFQVVGTDNTIQIYNGNFTRCSLSNGDASGLAAVTANSYGAGAAIKCNGDLIPGSGSLGSSGSPWSDVYSVNAPTVTSDARTKKDISTSNLGLDFIMALRPVSYRIIQSGQKITEVREVEGPTLTGEPERHVTYEPTAGVRTHYGLIAQEVRQAMVKSGADDAAMWVLADKDDPDSKQALRYEEFISPMIKAIQELTEIVKKQAEEIAVLKLKVS